MRGFQRISAAVFCTFVLSGAGVAWGQTTPPATVPSAPELRQKKAAALLADARKLYDAGQYREALDLLRQATIIDPQNVDAALLLNLVLGKIDELEKQNAPGPNGQGIPGAESAVPRPAVAGVTPSVTFSSSLPPPARTVLPGLSQKDVAARDKLEENLKEMVATDQPLDKVLMFLRDNMGATILVNWGALHEAGVEKSSLVTTSLKEVTFRKALTTVLAQVSAGKASLAYTVQEGAIVISTKSDLSADGAAVDVVFDIRDMLGVGAGPQVTPAGVKMSDAVEAARIRAHAAADLIDAIRTAVAPDSWKDSGGSLGTIQEKDGLLTVHQTLENQIAVLHLLQQLRESRSFVIAMEGRVVLVPSNFLDDFRMDWSEPKPPIAAGATSAPDPKAAGTSPEPAVKFRLATIDNWTLSLLLTATQADKRTVTLTAARTLIFNGGEAVLDCPLPLRYVSGVVSKPVPIEADSFVPMYATAATGLNMAVRGAVSPDRRAVVIIAKPVVRTITRLTEETRPKLPQSFMVQRPTIIPRSADLGLSIPDGGCLLVDAGEVVVGSGDPEQTLTDAVTSKRRMLILLRPNIVVSRGEEDIFGVGFDRPTGLPGNSGTIGTKP